MNFDTKDTPKPEILSFYEYHEKKEQSYYDGEKDIFGKEKNLAYSKERYEQAKEARADWEKQYDRVLKIYNQEKGALGGYHNNNSQVEIVWNNKLKEYITFNVAYLDNSEIDFSVLDIQNSTENAEKRRAMNFLINDAVDDFKLANKLPTINRKFCLSGLRVLEARWNYKRKLGYWKTGTIDFNAVDPMNFYYFATGDDPELNDIYECFHIKTMHVGELVEKLPHLADKIKEAYSNYLDTNKYRTDTNSIPGLVDIVIRQYKKTVELKRRSFSYDIGDDSRTSYITEEEYEDFKKSGNTLNENIEVSEPFVDEIDLWFENIFIDQFNITLQKPTFVGEYSNYIVGAAELKTNTCYPISKASDVVELTRLSTLFTTYAAQYLELSAAPTFESFPDAILNFNAVKDNIGKPGVNIVKDTAWAEAHPGLKPFEMINLNNRSGELLSFAQVLENMQKNLTGAVDAQRGQTSPNVTSGRQQEVLFETSSVYLKTEVTNYIHFLGKVGDIIMRMLEENITFPIRKNDIEIIPGGEIDIVYGDYKIIPKINVNPEARSQVMAEIANVYAANGWITPVKAMEANNYPNAEKDFSEAQDMYSQQAQQMQQAQPAQ